MKKALFLSIILTISTLFLSCSAKPARSAQDCEFTCASIAENSLGTEIQGCVCQKKEKK